MTAAFGRAMAERLAKVLGILGSDHAGERAAAGYQAHRIITDAGLTWPDVITVPALPAPKPAPQDDIATLLTMACWTDWEREFLFGLSIRNAPPSAKQLAILERLRAKARDA